jgi:hypothetical protein
MSNRLMTEDELRQVTGKQRYSRQAEWFRKQFNFDPPRSASNAVVITWQTFQALQDRRAGLTAAPLPHDPPPPVYLLHKG